MHPMHRRRPSHPFVVARRGGTRAVFVAFWGDREAYVDQELALCARLAQRLDELVPCGIPAGGRPGARAAQPADHDAGLHRPGGTRPNDPPSAHGQAAGRRGAQRTLADVRLDVRRERSPVYPARAPPEVNALNCAELGAERAGLLRGVGVQPAVPLVSRHVPDRADCTSIAGIARPGPPAASSASARGPSTVRSAWHAAPALRPLPCLLRCCRIRSSP